MTEQEVFELFQTVITLISLNILIVILMKIILKFKSNINNYLKGFSKE